VPVPPSLEDEKLRSVQLGPSQAARVSEDPGSSESGNLVVRDRVANLEPRDDLTPPGAEDEAHQRLGFRPLSGDVLPCSLEAGSVDCVISLVAHAGDSRCSFG